MAGGESSTSFNYKFQLLCEHVRLYWSIFSPALFARPSPGRWCTFSYTNGNKNDDPALADSLNSLVYGVTWRTIKLNPIVALLSLI